MGRRDLRRSGDQGAVRQDNFAGLNNVDDDNRLASSELRKAVNVDVTREGKIKRRRGFASVYTGDNIRSLIDFGPHTLFAEGTALKALNDGTPQTWFSQLHEHNKLAHVERDEVLYFTDGTANYWASRGGDVSPLTVPTPARPPTLVSSASDARMGTVRFVLTYQDALGQESAASTPLSAQTSAYSPSVVLGGFPTPPSGVDRVNLYTTTLDGNTYYRERSIPVSFLVPGYEIVVNPQAVDGRELRTQHLSPLPSGSLMTYALGRLWVAADNVVWYSEPLYYGLTNLAHNYFIYGKDVSLLIGLEEAVIVVADGHYSLVGSSDTEIQQAKLLSYGAPKGNVVYSEVSKLGLEGLGIGAAWLSDKGFVVANGQGAIVNQTEGRVAMPSYDEAAVMLREEEGARRLVAAARSKGQTAQFAVKDDWDVEVRRNGVII